MNITSNEALVLDEIAHHEMNETNGATPTEASQVHTYGWADDFGGGKLTTNQVKGVLSSLSKKGLIGVQHDDDDSTIWFTDAGFEVWQASRETGDANDDEPKGAIETLAAELNAKPAKVRRVLRAAGFSAPYHVENLDAFRAAF